MLERLEGNLESFAAIRSHRVENEVAPALVFDPDPITYHPPPVEIQNPTPVLEYQYIVEDEPAAETFVVSGVDIFSNMFATISGDIGSSLIGVITW